MARSVIPAISHDLLDLAIDGEFPYPATSASSYCARAATASLISRSRRHFAHRLAVARQIMASQPGWTNRYRSTSRAEYTKPSLVDGIRVPNAVRSIASSRSNTVISARRKTKRAKWISVVRAWGEFLGPPSTNLAGDRCDRSRRNSSGAKHRRRQNLRGKTKTPTARSRLPLPLQASLPEVTLAPLRNSPWSASIVGRIVVSIARANAQGLSRRAVTPDGGRLRIQHRILRQIVGEGRIFPGSRPARRVLPPSWCKLP